MPYTIALDARKIRDFGIGTYVRNLVAGLAGIDRENRYLLLAPPEDRELLSGLPANFEVVPESSGVYSLREVASLSWRLLRLRPDLYHATHYVLPLYVPGKVVVTIHDIIHVLYPEFLPNGLAFVYATHMIRRSLERGDRIVAVSVNTRQDLIDHFGVDGQKIEVVYNGVEEIYRRPLAPEEIERRLAALGVERPYLLFVGNPKPHKNLDNVVKAYARARRLGGFDAALVCVGDRTPGESRIRQRAEQLGVGDRVKLLGHVEQDDLPALYQGAALFLYPTLYEGFGLPVVEAMASGVPVITSNTSALKEIAEGYGHLVDPLDLDAMALAITRCMTDAEYRTQLIEGGRLRARAFRWEEAARSTREIYLQAIEDAPLRERIRKPEGPR
ncbi:MAG TPA: glycosyltransferase family 1 protein [Thermoanaerobaculia bacterium]|nr:glycosyltransferase family 1 protein [Thermoanaerobaculia bacterium]